MLLRLIFLFTLVPLVELYLLFKISERSGPKFTIALVIATGVLGAILARKQGMRWRQTMAAQLQRGELPSDGLFDGLIIFVAGAMLVTPGVITDVFGFSLLLPSIRSWVKGRVRKRIEKSFGPTAGTHGAWGGDGKESNRDVVIESHVIENQRERGKKDE